MGVGLGRPGGSTGWGPRGRRRSRPDGRATEPLGVGAARSCSATAPAVEWRLHGNKGTNIAGKPSVKSISCRHTPTLYTTAARRCRLHSLTRSYCPVPRQMWPFFNRCGAVPTVMPSFSFPRCGSPSAPRNDNRTCSAPAGPDTGTKASRILPPCPKTGKEPHLALASSSRPDMPGPQDVRQALKPPSG